MDDSDRRDLIEKIIKENLGEAYNYKAPKAIKSVGPSYPEVFKEFEERVQALTTELRETLSKFDIERLRAEYDVPFESWANLLNKKNSIHFQLVPRLRALRADLPKFYLNGWASPNKGDAFTYFRGHRDITLAQATLLSVGRDPRFVAFGSLFKNYRLELLYPGRTVAEGELSNIQKNNLMLDFLSDRFEAIAAGVGADPENDDSPVDVDDLAYWVLITGVEIDPDFRKMLEVQRSLKTGLKTPPRPNATSNASDKEEKPLHGNTMRAHAKVVLGLLLALKLEPSALSRRGIAERISNLLELEGVHVDDKTIRDLSRLFKELLEKVQTGEPD